MKLLIIEDNESIARVTTELLYTIDRKFGKGVMESIATAPDLESALDGLLCFDAILCDGEFPNEPGSRFTFSNWSIVANRARKLHIPCVIYSGSAAVVDEAGRCGLPVLQKPAPVETIYAVLVGLTSELKAA
jgi:CheY-like chemotaxis protein